MPTEYEGGCHCGNIRYTCTELPEFTFYCHCTDCQRTGGSPFSVELMIPIASFDVRGDLDTYPVVGDSGKDVHRRFCPRCGSGVYLECDADPGYLFLKAATLDDASWVRPEMHVCTASQQPWVEFEDELPRYETVPEE